MARAKKSPAPRRPAGASRKEVKFLVPGHARGAEAYLLVRRKAGRWSVTDTFRGRPAYVGAGEVWRELKPETPDAEVYRWSQSQARALAARFVEQAVEIHRRCAAPEPAVRMDRPLAPVLPLQRRQGRPVVPEATGPCTGGLGTMSVPAPVLHPDWRPRPPEARPLNQPLTLLGASIPANCEAETVALHTPFPRCPNYPPTVHLTEARRHAGERARASVASATA